MQGSKHKVASFARRWAQAAKQRNTPADQRIIATGNCVQCPDSHRYVVAPAVDGRIQLIGPSAEVQQPAVESPLKPGQGTSTVLA